MVLSKLLQNQKADSQSYAGDVILFHTSIIASLSLFTRGVKNDR